MTKEFEELKKLLDISDLINSEITREKAREKMGSIKDGGRVVCQYNFEHKILSFISQHFLPKSKVRERLESMKKGNVVSIQMGYDVGFRQGFNDALEQILKDLDL